MLLYGDIVQGNRDCAIRCSGASYNDIATYS